MYNIPSKLNTLTTNFCIYSLTDRSFENASRFLHEVCKANSRIRPSTVSQILRTCSLHPSGFSRSSCYRSNPRPISNSQLHTLRCFHLCPINLVVFKGSYFFRMGVLILRGASRLDAFSVYPFRTWLLGRRLGSLTDTPAVRPSRSSRTKDSSFQNSCAHAG